jgi:hypothetical protein
MSDAENEGDEPSPQPRLLSLRAGAWPACSRRSRAGTGPRARSAPTTHGVPGLLQTRAYIDSLFAAGHLAVPLTEEGIMARLARQGVLHDESKHFEFLLYEGALRWDFDVARSTHARRSAPTITLRSSSIGRCPPWKSRSSSIVRTRRPW